MQSEDKACVVVVTCPSDEEASNLAEALVKRRLAACVQIVPIHSYYRWNEVVNHSQEKQLLIKTMSSCYEKLEEFVLEKHSYDCPEIIRLPIEGGFSGYPGLGKI